VDVIRIDFGKHFFKHGSHPGSLFVAEFEYMLTRRLKYRILVQLAEVVKEMLIENTIDPRSNVFQIDAAVRNLRIGKEQGLFLHSHHFVGIVHVDVAIHQHDFEKVAPPVGQWSALARLYRHVLKYVEMPDLLFNVVGYPAESALVKIFYGFDFIHVATGFDIPARVFPQIGVVFPQIGAGFPAD
jgi:hypothetical protein